MAYSYINFGVEGTTEGDNEGIFDYIQSVSGSSYENTGFATKGYIPEGMTLQQLEDKLLNILKNGIY